MRITKTITKSVTYYECEPIKNTHLFAFTLRRLIIDLIRVYGYAWFKPLNLN